MDEKKLTRQAREVGDEWTEVCHKDGLLHRYRLEDTSYMVNERYLQTMVRIVDLGVVEDDSEYPNDDLPF